MTIGVLTLKEVETGNAAVVANKVFAAHLYVYTKLYHQSSCGINSPWAITLYVVYLNKKNYKYKYINKSNKLSIN